MIKVRKSKNRGYADHGWLEAKHTFSFGSYYDPKYIGFRDLLVLNEDRIEASKGFGLHPHKDMEIITYMVDGEIEHTDSMGNTQVLKKGEIQRMSAGKGILHSEVNSNQNIEAHLYQIWIQTERLRIEPSYEQEDFSNELNSETLKLAVSKGNSKLTVNQNTQIWIGKISSPQEFELSLGHAWVQVVKGNISIEKENLVTGDGAEISNLSKIKLAPNEETELFIIELT